MFKLHFTSAFLLMDISKSLVVELNLVSYKTQTLSYILSKEYKSINFFSNYVSYMPGQKHSAENSNIHSSIYNIYILT